jgi:hypothetical protein
LLLLLAELVHELLDLLALSCPVARGVVHWASCATVIAARCLMGALVASSAMAPTSYCSCSSGSSSQRLVVAAGLLLLVLVFVVVTAALGSGTYGRLAFLPCL